MSGTLTAYEPATEERVVVSAAASAAPGGYSIAIGYLRAFVTLMVLAHHAVLAYHSAAPPPPASLVAQPRWWEAFPIVDKANWNGFGLLVGFNDTFFMSLMFFLSGLFVWRSLERKGGAHFLRDRFLRLGLPFVVAAAFVAPLAYYPAYLQTGASAGFAGFWRDWLALGNWPAGPAWFIWLLLAFDCAAATLFALAPRWGEVLGRTLSGLSRRPAVFFALMVAVSAAVYIPLALIFNPFQWTSFGPFFFQTSRLLHYLVYFLAGIALGACGIERGLLAPDGKLARRWPLWMIGSLVAFALALVVFLAAISAKSSPQFWGTVGGATFALSCAASSFFFLAVFVRFAKTSTRVFDSLRDNAYGMYLIHYAFVSWLQLALLRAPLSGLTKGILVTLGTVLLSWGAVAALRRIPRVSRVI